MLSLGAINWCVLMCHVSWQGQLLMGGSSPLPSTINTLIAIFVNHQHTHRHVKPSTHSSPAPQPSTHSLPSPSTINTLIAIATDNHRHQPLTHSLPTPSTIGVLIAVTGNNRHTHRRCPSTHDLINTLIALCPQPSTHSLPLLATINALIVTIDTLITMHSSHCRHRQPSTQPLTHSSPSPATINLLIAVTVNQLTVSGVSVGVTINALSLDAMLIYYYLYAAFSPLPSITQHDIHLQWIKELCCSNGIWLRLVVLSKNHCYVLIHVLIGISMDLFFNHPTTLDNNNNNNNNSHYATTRA